MKQTIIINGKPIGPSHPPYLVAELSANHNGNLDQAMEMISAAKKTGADAVKLQTYRADTITLDCNRDEFLITKGRNAGKTLYELYEQAYTPWEWHENLFQHARNLGITIFSSPFDLTAVDYLENLQCDAYKIASCELVDIPLIKKAALTGKPIIMSTGLATFPEIEEAIETVLETGNDNLIILHCVSGYPTPIEESNLRTISDLINKTGCVVGLSDHTKTVDTSIAAIALGACFIEKHFNIEGNDNSLDAAFSLNTNEFTDLVDRVHAVFRGLGTVDYTIKKSEEYTKRLRRSLYIVKDVPKGEKLTSDHVRSIRPNNGLAPKYMDNVLTMKAKMDIPRGTPLSWELLDK